MSINANEIRELSIDELDTVCGAGKNIGIGPIRITTYDDGSFGIGIKGIGDLYFGEGKVQACPENGTCVPLT